MSPIKRLIPVALLILAGVILGVILAVQSVAAATPVFNPANGHYYEFVSTPEKWDDARDAAEQMDYLGCTGHLATITSAAEDTFIKDNFPGRYWLGGYQDPPDTLVSDANWTWVTGEHWSYTGWQAGEPNDFPTGPDTGLEQALAMDQFINVTITRGWLDDRRTDVTFIDPIRNEEVTIEASQVPYLVEYDGPCSRLTITKETTPAGGTDFPFTINTGPYEYLDQWGGQGGLEGQFNNPWGVAIDAAGNFFVADLNNNRIQKFDSSGAFLRAWGWGVDNGANAFQICTTTCQAGISGNGNGQFNRPIGIGIDSGGNVYVADQGNARIQKFDNNGTFLGIVVTGGSGAGQVSGPTSVSFDAADNMYVVDYGNNRVQKFDSAVTFLRMWGWGVQNGANAFQICTGGCQAGIGGNGVGQFNFPVGGAVDATGNVYVTSQAGQKILKFDSDGNLLLEWGSGGNANGQFNAPTDVTVDAAGDVYVADLNNNRIQKFDSAGNFITTFGSGGGGNGQLSQPTGVAVDANRNVIVSDYGNHRMQVFTPGPTNFNLDDGQSEVFDLGPGPYRVEELVPAGWDLTGIACDTEEYETDGSSVEVYLSNGQDVECTFSNERLPRLTITKETTPAGGQDFPFTIDPGTYSFDFKWGANGGDGSSGTGNGQFDVPNRVAVDATGNVYVADTGNNRIQKFNSSGVYLTQWGTLGSGNGQFNAPTGLAVDATGNVYVSDSSNDRIQKFDSNGAYVTQWGSTGSGPGQFRTPVGVAVDAAGHVFVADIVNQRIQKFDSSGNFLAQWGTFGSGDGQFDFPTGVAVDGAGNVYVADTYNDRIQKFDGSGGFVTKWGSTGSGDGQFTYPEGVAVDAAGNVFVADTYNRRIQKFDTSGVYLTQWGSTGSGDGQFDFPTGVAVDAAGHVYVADLYNNRIQVFNPDLTTILDDGQSDSFDLEPGIYLVSELVPEAWTLTGISCSVEIPLFIPGDTGVQLNLSNGDDVECTFYNEREVGPSVCPVDDERVGFAMSTIVGNGMSDDKKLRLASKIFVPDYTELTALYGQLAGKGPEYAVKYVRFFYPKTPPPQPAKIFIQESPAYLPGAIHWYGMELDPARLDVTGGLKGNMRARWYLTATGKKFKTPRASIYYPTYDTGDEHYANVLALFDDSNTNHVANDPGYHPTATQIVEIPETQGVVDLTVQVAIVDVMDDDRPVMLHIEAGGVVFDTTLLTPTDGPSLNIVDVLLEDVPAGTDEVTIMLTSPAPDLLYPDGGDSAAMVGAVVNYACGEEEIPEP